MCLGKIGPVLLEIHVKQTAETTRLVRCDRRCTSSSHFASVAFVFAKSCDNLNLNNCVSFQSILLWFVAYDAPMWGILFFNFRFWISKIFWEGGPKIGGGMKIEKLEQRLQFLTDFARVCFKRCVLTMLKKRWEQFFYFQFLEFFGGKKLKKSPKKVEKNVCSPSIFHQFCPLLL